MEQLRNKLRKRPRIQLRQPLTQSTSFPQLKKEASIIKDLIKPSPSQVAITAAKWVESATKTHTKQHTVVPLSPVPSDITEDIGDDTTLAELDSDDDKDDVFLEVKLLVDVDYSVLVAEEEIQGASTTSEDLQLVYYSPLFYPFGCIECVLGAPQDAPTHDSIGDTQVSVSTTEATDTTADEVVVASDGGW